MAIIKLENLKKLLIVFGLVMSIVCQGQQISRELKIVEFSGRGYELGLQHGKELKNEIEEIITAWKKNVSNSLGKDANLVLKEFFEYAEFKEAIMKWTPELYEEVKGIAEGSGQRLNDVMVLNLLDEFWVYINNLNNHHCSSVGVPSRNGSPGYISQNMDLENYTDGFQVLMRLNKNNDSPEQLILTHPGLIVLNGLNEEGIGVCVNTLMQLKASSNGLPVAFVIRQIINSTSKENLLSFIQNVNHASGQNYIIGIKGEVYDFEASANKVVRYNPNNKNGTVYHTNHPIVNDDIKPWFEKYHPNLKEELRPTSSNSHLRFKAVENRMKSKSEVSDVLIKEALRSRDNEGNPVCRTNNENGRGFTFASIIMTFSDNPHIQILAGPPDEAKYKKVEFTTKK
ncbi:MAG: isopenicillin-N N-acyltransferase-like protein [Saprospiraceae bacterium]